MSGANVWELERDIALARRRGQATGDLEAALAAVRASCAHLANPEHPDRCLWCGAPSRPGLAKARRSPLSLTVKRSGT